MDAIDRQAAIDVADKFSDADGCNGSDVAMDIISGLISLPSVQPEIVRCKDCKWWRLSDYNTLGIHVCKKFSGVRGESDFCSRAEPYKGEQE